jgi:hypothetical protein
MAYSVKPANIFGRIGTGLGKGLAEQLPKEMERNRLASGLKAFEEEHQNLTPIQQLSRAAAIPGATPQLLQSLTELAKVQNQGNAYRNSAGRGTEQQSRASPYLPQNEQEAQWMSSLGINPQQQDQQIPGTKLAPQGTQSRGLPGRENINENTINPAAKTAIPWSSQRMDQEILNDIDAGFLPEQAQQRAKDREARELGLPPVLQQRQKEDMERTVTARNELDRQLETKFQKTGEGVYQDLPGEMKINLERSMLKALRRNPNLQIEDAAHEFSEKALATAKARNQFDKTAKTTGIETLGKGDKILSKLNEYSDVFKDSGNSEEYYNILKKEPLDGGMGLSSEASATVAFPINSQWKNYVSKFHPQNLKQTKYGEVIDPKRTEANSRKAASDISKLIGEDDSLLSIARALRQKDPYFDQEAFFDEIKQNIDTLNLNDRQRREIPERNTDWLPKWGDFLIFPWNTR